MTSQGTAFKKPLSKVVRDPVHNLIRLTGDDGELVLTLMDRPEFQRLRRVRQLGLAFFTYPGAEHSRWAHSFGVCHIASRMIKRLLEHYGDSVPGVEIVKRRREIIAAALLHDLGHGPFSHVFERAVPPAMEPPKGYPTSHEGWSERIINDCFREDLKRFGVDTDVVIGLINKKSRSNLLAKDLISSQLDADRMDYLLRDSRATGARYGEFDLEWLLHSLRIGKVPIQGQADGVHRLCFHAGKAIHVVEEYIQAREFMYVQVYVHKTTRAFEAMLTSIFGLAAAITDGSVARAPAPCPPALAKILARQAVSTEEYLSLDDFRLWCTLADWAVISDGGDELKRMLGSKCRRLVNRDQPYKTLELRDDAKREKSIELVTELRQTPQRHSIVRDSFQDLAYRNVFYRKSPEDEDQADRVIQFIDDREQTHPAEALSDVIRAISEVETRIHRLYYDETDATLVQRLKEQDWI